MQTPSYSEFADGAWPIKSAMLNALAGTKNAAIQHVGEKLRQVFAK